MTVADLIAALSALPQHHEVELLLGKSEPDAEERLDRAAAHGLDDDRPGGVPGLRLPVSEVVQHTGWHGPSVVIQ